MVPVWQNHRVPEIWLVRRLASPLALFSSASFALRFPPTVANELRGGIDLMNVARSGIRQAGLGLDWNSDRVPLALGSRSDRRAKSLRFAPSINFSAISTISFLFSSSIPHFPSLKVLPKGNLPHVGNSRFALAILFNMDFLFCSFAPN